VDRAGGADSSPSAFRILWPVGKFQDDFVADRLSPERWVDHYLPQWTTPDRSQARWMVGDAGLKLHIEADQPAWREPDGPMRVSNVQTGTFSGPAGSREGTHRHRLDGLQVVTPQPLRRLWTPTGGRVAVTASASPDPTCMLGIWLVGFEAYGPRDSGEICLAEVFGDRVDAARSTVRTGIKAHHDPRLSTDLSDVVLPIDAIEPHEYAAEWDATGVRLMVDGATVKSSAQVLTYELQLMVGLFEFPESDRREPAAYPKTAIVRSVLGTG